MVFRIVHRYFHFSYIPNFRNSSILLSVNKGSELYFITGNLVAELTVFYKKFEIFNLLFMQKCGLCREEKELKKSHLMPKSLYGALRNAFPGKGKEIVWGKRKQGSANYSDYQVKNSFLCGDCEQKFNKKGENVVTKECHHGAGRFILLDKIINEKVIDKSEGQRWIDPNKIKYIDADVYSYFALSVIWRASVGNWPTGLKTVKNSLGIKYEKQIRKYLLGESGIPSNIFIGVYVDHDKDGYPSMFFPTVAKKEGYHHHIFYIPGVKFSIMIGSKVNGVKELFEAYNTNIFFIEYSFQKSKDFKQLVKFINYEIQPKGRLAKDINWK